jgi:hypothetical protein
VILISRISSIVGTISITITTLIIIIIFCTVSVIVAIRHVSIIYMYS